MKKSKKAQPKILFKEAQKAMRKLQKKKERKKVKTSKRPVIKRKSLFHASILNLRNNQNLVKKSKRNKTPHTKKLYKKRQ